MFPFKEKDLQPQKEKSRSVVAGRKTSTVLAIRRDFSMGKEASSECCRQGSMGVSSGPGVNFTASHKTFISLKSRTYWCLMIFHWDFGGWFCSFVFDLEKPGEHLPRGLIYSRKNKRMFCDFTCLEVEF